MWCCAQIDMSSTAVVYPRAAPAQKRAFGDFSYTSSKRVVARDLRSCMTCGAHGESTRVCSLCSTQTCELCTVCCVECGSHRCSEHDEVCCAPCNMCDATATLECALCNIGICTGCALDVPGGTGLMCAEHQEFYEERCTLCGDVVCYAGANMKEHASCAVCNQPNCAACCAAGDVDCQSRCAACRRYDVCSLFVRADRGWVHVGCA